MNLKIPPHHLLILGTSTRAAAWSAIRAGLHVSGADPFQDRDLSAVANTIPILDFPASIVRDLINWRSANGERANWDGILLTGAMENHGDTVRELRQFLTDVPLLGASVEGLEKSRDVVSWTAELARQGLPHLPVVVSPELPTGNWFWKPFRSGGGRNVVSGHGPANNSFDEPGYFQQRGLGIPMSAVVTALPEQPLRMIGITRQLIGWQPCPWKYAWCGSIGPMELPVAATEQLLVIADTLRNFCSLKGLFGLDFLWDGSTPFVNEINPRYPGSLEVLEAARSVSTLGDSPHAAETSSPVSQRRFVAKRIVYAERDLVIRSRTVRVSGKRILETLRGLKPTPWLADIPRPESIIPRGSPLCTVFATSQSYRRCLLELGRRAAMAIRLLAEPAGGKFENR